MVFAQDVSPDQPEAPAATSLPRKAQQAFYLELGGNGILYSLNYERFVSQTVSLRVGGGYYSVSTPNGPDVGASASISWIPLLVNYLGVGSGDNRLELGVGVVPIYATAAVDTGAAEASSSGVLLTGTASVAYRYIPRDGGFNFKVALPRA